MSCKYCERPAFYAVHHGIKVPPIMTCQKHILKGISGVFLAQDTYQVTVQDMNKYALWKNRNFTKNYGSRPKVKDNSYHMTLVDTWLSGFKSIMDAKPIRITFRYARREPLTMVIPAKQWNNLKLAFLERPEIYKIDDAHLAGGATITHYINRHRAWYLDVWDVAKKIKLVFGPLHLDAYQGDCRIEPAPLGFEEDIKLENPTTGEVSGLSLFNPVTPGFGKNLSKFLLSQLNPYKHGVINPDFEDAVQTLLEKSLNTPVSGKVANKAEKPHYLCQSDFCFKCGDRVTNTGSSFGYNQRVVCLKCFRKAEKAPVIPEAVRSIKCATCGASNYTHALGSKVYCQKCWDNLKCCHCDKTVGYNSVAYNGRVFCNSCYDQLSKDPSPVLEQRVYTRSEFMEKNPNNPDAYRIMGGGVGNISFIVIDDSDSKVSVGIDPATDNIGCKNCGKPLLEANNDGYCPECKVTKRFEDMSPAEKVEQAKSDELYGITRCPECQGPLGLDAMTILDGSSVCKTCYDRFYNIEINYRCKGCGAIIPDKGKICNKCGPECAHCKTHQGPFKTIDHKLYCVVCASKPLCWECKQPLGEDAVSIPDNYTVCKACYDKKPKCPVCGKPADGVCAACSKKDDKTSHA
jgi:phage FluMu protein Com